ncbi:hypothetical protein CEXT_576891 [Caerostris extrusa]|uniref:Uncharacterized protein n=1 Tax=Caerostris extrusa TaxID=172846 RepID=A0AAV4XM50_CAEEX|nr:hypothetical protein CEXT_576891 [Caerostris extrusa]
MKEIKQTTRYLPFATICASHTKQKDYNTLQFVHWPNTTLFLTMAIKSNNTSGLFDMEVCRGVVPQDYCTQRVRHYVSLAELTNSLNLNYISNIAHVRGIFRNLNS